MNVKDLIHELLDCAMDAEVEVVIDSDGYENDFSDITVENKVIFQNQYVRLNIDIGSMILVEKSEYDELKDRVEDLEAELEEMKK